MSQRLSPIISTSPCSPFITLCDLKDGRKLCGDSKEPLVPPDNFDMQKFDRGRIFFRDHILNCMIAMLFSLIIGMSVPELLEALVFTKESDTPQKAMKRYLSTFRHVALWHYGNVWDTSSEAFKSIKCVRDLHNKVRIQMGNHINTEQVFLSQYDMGIVQSGFMGIIVMHHKNVGIDCSFQDIDDYVYFWYGIGHLLGIKKEYNICAHGTPQALMFCKEIEEIVIKNLNKPSPNFKLMTNAVIEGFTHGRNVLTLLSFPVIKYLSLEAQIGKEPFKTLCTLDKIRYFLWKLLFLCTSYFPGFNKFVRLGVEKIYKLNVDEELLEHKQN